MIAAQRFQRDVTADIAGCSDQCDFHDASFTKLYVSNIDTYLVKKMRRIASRITSLYCLCLPLKACTMSRTVTAPITDSIAPSARSNTVVNTAVIPRPTSQAGLGALL